MEGGGTRTGGQRVLEPLEVGSRKYDVAASQGLERRIELGSQIHAASNATKLEDFGTH